MIEYLKDFITGVLLILAATVTTINSETVSQDYLYLVKENQVVKVIDGDTIEVYLNGKIQKVRMLGINTPETVDPRKPVECFGIEASNKLREILEGKIVRLEEDKSQDNYDKFDRALRYVFLDNENINFKMVNEGYAFEYTYKKPYKFQKEFKEAEKNAHEKSIGLWNNETCDY